MNREDAVGHIKELLKRSNDPHDIFTPIELCHEILEKIPGIGQEKNIAVMTNMEFVYALLEKHGRSYLKNVWFFTPCDIKKRVAISMGVNENHVVMLKYNKQIEFNEDNMPKFDVVIGNPPYKGNLYIDFMNLAYTISDKYISFVHPGTFYFNEKNNRRQKRELLLKENIKHNIKEIRVINARKFFNIALWAPMTITYINKEIINKNIKVIDTIHNNIFVYDNINDINKWGNYEEYYSLKKKILSISLKNNILQHSNKLKGNYVVQISQLRGHSYTDDMTKLTGDDFYTLIPRNYEITNIINKKYGWNNYSFNTKIEANNFLDYLKTYFVRFALSLHKINMNLNRGELKTIPWLDFNEKWTDEKLFKHFKLTDKEINFIKTHIPKYY